MRFCTAYWCSASPPTSPSPACQSGSRSTQWWSPCYISTRSHSSPAALYRSPESDWGYFDGLSAHDLKGLGSGCSHGRKFVSDQLINLVIFLKGEADLQSLRGYSAWVDGGLDQELLLLVTSQIDGLGDEGVDLCVCVVAGQLDVGLVVLLEKSGRKVAQTERDVEGGTDGCDVGLLAFLNGWGSTIIVVDRYRIWEYALSILWQKNPYFMSLDGLWYEFWSLALLFGSISSNSRHSRNMPNSRYLGSPTCLTIVNNRTIYIPH